MSRAEEHEERAIISPVIGWREWITFPELFGSEIKAKIDTGARTSAIHAENIRTFTDQGTPHVSFLVYPVQRQKEPAVECVSEIVDEREVTSSTGQKETRHVIKTLVSHGSVIWPIELTLANRDLLGFRVLLGREAIRGRFLVDPISSFLAGRCFADVSFISTEQR